MDNDDRLLGMPTMHTIHNALATIDKPYGWRRHDDILGRHVTLYYHYPKRARWAMPLLRSQAIDAIRKEGREGYTFVKVEPGYFIVDGLDTATTLVSVRTYNDRDAYHAAAIDHMLEYATRCRDWFKV